MKDLNFHTRPHKPRSRAWQNDAPMPAEKPKKQVRFDVEGDLGNDLILPPGLTLFLMECLAEEQDDAPDPVTSLPEESFQPPPSKVPSTAPPIQKEPVLKLLPGHLLVNPNPDPD